MRTDISDDLLQTILAIPGSTDKEEIALLYNLAKKNSRGCIVEVGSAKGRSTVALALGAKHGSNSPVYAIEPHEYFNGILGGKFTPENRRIFFTSLLRTHTTDIVRLVNLSSEVVTLGWKHAVGMIFIDGDHSYDGVKRDYACWIPHIAPGGILIFHDSTDTTIGPCRVINEAIAEGDLEKVAVVSRATILKKVA
jgi:predicted O-methyltransferase YrrM